MKIKKGISMNVPVAQTQHSEWRYNEEYNENESGYFDECASSDNTAKRMRV